MRDWSKWPQEYYETTEREERLEMLRERLKSEEADEKDQIRMKFWELRYGQREKMPCGSGRSYFHRWSRNARQNNR